jgi:hypothetical protein
MKPEVERCGEEAALCNAIRLDGVKEEEEEEEEIAEGRVSELMSSVGVKSSFLGVILWRSARQAPKF